MTMKQEKKRIYLRAALALAALLVVLLALDNLSFVPSMLLTVLRKGAIYALVAVSMNLLNGFTGLFSLGQAGFMLLEEIAAALQKFLADCVINGFVNDHRLLRCADHAVVKCLRVYDRVYRLADIRRGIDHCRGVAGANAQRRFAAGICCTHHSRTAGCQNDVSLLHQRVGHFQRRNVDPADDILRCTCLHGCIQHDLRRSDGAFLCTGMGRNDNGISGFQADQRLKDRR